MWKFRRTASSFVRRCDRRSHCDRAAAYDPGIQNAACPVNIVIFNHFRLINMVICINNNNIFVDGTVTIIAVVQNIM